MLYVHGKQLRSCWDGQYAGTLLAKRTCYRPSYRAQFSNHLSRVGKVAEFQRSSSFDHLTAVTDVGSSPALATRETSQVLLAGVSGGFPGVLPFRPTYRLARLDMSVIILKGTLN